MPVSAVSSAAYASTDLLVQTASWLRTETATRAEAAAQSAQTQRSLWLADETGNGQAWTDGLGSRFAPDTANTLLSAQETASSTGAAGQAQHAFYFDPLDTNRDGKVSYLEWLAGQTTSATETATTTEAAAAGAAAPTAAA